MISLRFANADCEPAYMTEHSAGADLRAREACIIKAGSVARVPTGVWIAQVEWDRLPHGAIPELQVRARSSLAFKKSIGLANGVGTIDADYPDEICVLLHNFGKEDVTLERGERVAQLVFTLAYRIEGLSVGEKRTGGFGSTGAK
jgi:dUTP pyrophosphatase